MEKQHFVTIIINYFVNEAFQYVNNPLGGVKVMPEIQSKVKIHEKNG